MATMQNYTIKTRCSIIIVLFSLVDVGKARGCFRLHLLAFDEEPDGWLVV